ncbi:MAG TPA: transposase, partial [Syntrophomonadaceae bacterium]|nr:transposase [Syntrophomonadaceae bacterium]
ITGFFETYLKLNPEEEKELEKRIKLLNPKEAEEMLELTTSWHEKGRQEGRQEGELKKAWEMARNMLLDGEVVEKVIKYTGLEKEEINKLKREIEG